VVSGHSSVRRRGGEGETLKRRPITNLGKPLLNIDLSVCLPARMRFAAMLQAALDGEPTTSAQSPTLNAVGGAVSYLRTALLDKAVLPAARYAALPPAGAIASRYGPADRPGGEEGPEYMALDGAAMQNLEVPN
jgi:hypothetical protein